MDLLKKLCSSPIRYSRNTKEETTPILKYNMAAPTPANIKGGKPVLTNILFKNTYPAPTPYVAKLPYHTSMPE